MTLACPACGSNYLHFDRVTVYPRVEDEDCDPVVVPVPDGPPGRPRDLPTTPMNPSARRSGIVIDGWCEGCDQRWAIEVEQHKGQTMMEGTEIATGYSPIAES